MAEQSAQDESMAKNMELSLRELSVKDPPLDSTNTKDNAIDDIEDPQNRSSTHLEEPGNSQSKHTAAPSAKFTQHGEDYAGESSRTETTSVLSTGNEDVHVRDAGKVLGTLSAKDAFHKYIYKYFPNLDTTVYMTPPIPVGHPPVMREKTEFGYIYSPEYYYLLGDESEKRVAKCLEYLFKHLTDEKYLLFSSSHLTILTTLYDNKCEEKGEHDVLIIHYKYGLIFIETKGCMGKSDDAVASVIQTCLSQQEKNRRFFGTNFPGVKGVSTACILAFPNIFRKPFLSFSKSVKRIEKSGFSTHDCLFLDDTHIEKENSVTNLLEWWKRIAAKQKHGFTSLEEYRRVIERYIGEHSTVKIPVPSAGHEKEGPGKSYGQCVAGLGNRYSNIVLTPTQVAVHNSFIERLILRGRLRIGENNIAHLTSNKIVERREKGMCPKHG
ncbi:uncharacterized protein LOC124255702 [Haliotis rubra]|uniref:uncharacterized protein LOC124255702 n=1 Tax=Haliotis rubra TaxID=36100 RepID=UPI001EE5D2CF|nr:uncharacterized protein LOC124255702 [Haliotis rubra]XP_046545566.1 uncharacterized protein LOC124255702 [Haliotis rubra]